METSFDGSDVYTAFLILSTLPVVLLVDSNHAGAASLLSFRKGEVMVGNTGVPPHAVSVGFYKKLRKAFKKRNVSEALTVAYIHVLRRSTRIKFENLFYR